jgi:hypothetical protein
MIPSKRHPACTAAITGSASPITTCTRSHEPTAPVHASQRMCLRIG